MPQSLGEESGVCAPTLSWPQSDEPADARVPQQARGFAVRTLARHGGEQGQAIVGTVGHKRMDAKNLRLYVRVQDSENRRKSRQREGHTEASRIEVMKGPGVTLRAGNVRCASAPAGLGRPPGDPGNAENIAGALKRLQC